MSQANKGVDLHLIARNAMIERGFEPDYSAPALAQVAALHGAAAIDAPGLRDMRSLLWCSIDNDDSRDLDQLTFAENATTGAVKVYVAIADVDAVVKQSTPLDRHAERNTTSVYTAAQIFPMLPERLSTDLTSLNDQADRAVIVIEMLVGADGGVINSDIYRAAVRNRAKLAYNEVSVWLEGGGAIPGRVARQAGMDDQLRLQDQVAQRLRTLRFSHGALALDILQPKFVATDGPLEDLREEHRGRASLLIEDFMIAANGAMAQFLAGHGQPAIRRVVRVPKRWDRIVELARGLGVALPAISDASSLEKFLEERRRLDPEHFPDLSLAIVKMMGAGEYVVEMPGQSSVGHFGLAVRDYTHSTAPNRRFPDLITQRLAKAVLVGAKTPYSADELKRLAEHCTTQEDNAKKVERRVMKSATAHFVRDRLGEEFDAMVTGAAAKGTWVRILKPPVEGKLVGNTASVDVGDRLKVRLMHVDVARGFIDFAKA